MPNEYELALREKIKEAFPRFYYKDNENGWRFSISANPYVSLEIQDGKLVAREKWAQPVLETELGIEILMVHNVRRMKAEIRKAYQSSGQSLDDRYNASIHLIAKKVRSRLSKYIERVGLGMYDGKPGFQVYIIKDSVKAEPGGTHDLIRAEFIFARNLEDAKEKYRKGQIFRYGNLWKNITEGFREKHHGKFFTVEWSRWFISLLTKNSEWRCIKKVERQLAGDTPQPTSDPA